MDEMPEPEPQDGDVLVEVAAVGLCGSDMHGYLGHDSRRTPPLILGHEAAGTIVAGPRTGERVTLNPLVPNYESRFSKVGRTNICPDRQILSMPPRHGAFAERVVIPGANAVTVPDHVPFEKACLAEPLACGWHMVAMADRLMDQPIAGSRCLVIGAGAIGFGTALVLAAWGAGAVEIAETNPIRHPAVKADGRFALHEDGGDFDAVFDAVGYGATRAIASEKVRPGGVIGHIGLGDNTGGFDARRMTLHEIIAFGSYTYTQAEFQATADALYAGRLGPLDWTDIRPLEDGAAGFEDVAEGRATQPKLVFLPNP
ncbi:MAG: alcohol dehydrogenase catalytic domain-containing protein [Pseudomonadota bacterium]